MTTRRILITGSRSFYCHSLALRLLCALLEVEYKGQELLVVHGGCTGVDQAFEDTAKALGIHTEVHPARDHGTWPSCGPKRNSHMVSLGASKAIAVHADLARSKGTRDCVRKCLAAGIPVYHTDGQSRPRLLTSTDPELTGRLWRRS